MKRFLKFYQKDKLYIKMINQSEKGFELVIINSDALLNELLEIINTCEERDDEISIVWQMKHKNNNFIVYKDCHFSAPMDNFAPTTTNRYLHDGKGFNKSNEPVPLGKKIKVTCNGTSFYSDSIFYKDRTIKKSKDKYKDATLLTRMLKISELNLKSNE